MTFLEYVEKLYPEKLSKFQKTSLQNMGNEIQHGSMIFMVPKLGYSISKNFVLDFKNNWSDFDRKILEKVN